MDSSLGEINLFNNQSRENHHQDGEDDLYNQLWLACAGPLVNVPRVGDKVYYFPQGHLEQVESYMKQDGNFEMPIYNIPSKILCKVVYIHLKAEANTDEVFAQITLLPVREDQLSTEEARSLSPPQKSRAKSFSKRLTPSDTSTHGGFSIPKKYADEFFPTLDMSQEVPSEELVAKDLRGSLWPFRHIYRGQPKRHLLTSGWSVFVSTKKLAPGDTAIFLRGENGEVYVGVRRAKKPENTTAASVLSSISMRHGILATAFHAMTTGSMFTVYYRPWTDPAQFLVPYDQYMKSAEINYSFGLRFRMQLESVEWPEYMNQKFTGIVVGSEDIDCIRWPDSEWRRLKVQWDVTSDFRMLPVRVSPWSIVPIGDTKKKSISAPSKRPRPIDISTPKLPFIINDGLLKSPVERTKQRHFGVLQGQENKAVGAHEPDASAQPNGNGKFMLFGFDLFNTCSSSPQVISSSELSSLCNGPPSVSQSAISKTKCSNSVTIRSCTKVLKYGTALGRSIDLTHFKEYKELIYELDGMFDLKGTLVDGSSGWHVTYTNGKGDMLPLGDCPWPEFRAMVRKMFICPKEDGEKGNLM